MRRIVLVIIMSVLMLAPGTQSKAATSANMVLSLGIKPSIESLVVPERFVNLSYQSPDSTATVITITDEQLSSFPDTLTESYATLDLRAVITVY